MCTKEINLCGKICPFPIMLIIKEVDQMQKGDSITFAIDDPLALKSVPEELEDYSDIHFSTNKIDKGWEITIKRD